MRSRRSFLVRSMLGLGSVLLLVQGAPAVAQTSVSWRQSSVLAERRMEGAQPVMVRRGVAIFTTGEPATLTVRLLPSGRPVDGRMTVRHEFLFRFDDGSSLKAQGQGVSNVNPDGSAIPGEAVLSGQFVDGTGRFAGAAGPYTIRTRTDLSARTDGVLGEYFGEGEGKITFQK